MLNLPEKFIIFDTEYTTWPGAMERGWSGANEHKEIVEIAAIKVDGETLTEEDNLVIFVRPKLNPQLSEYFINLTGITQEKVDKEGIAFGEAIKKFKDWCGDMRLYCFGTDGERLEENCRLLGITFPFQLTQFKDAREIFKKHGIPADNYYSSTILTAFGKEIKRRGHEALNDARSILDGFRELAKMSK